MKDRLIRKFEEEIHALDRELKLELPQEIRRARELGDLRENAEYAAAKERQRLVEARISQLRKRVSEIALLNVDRIPAGFQNPKAGRSRVPLARNHHPMPRPHRLRRPKRNCDQQQCECAAHRLDSTMRVGMDRG